MSVLVWDGKTLACDSHANDGQVKFNYRKIWKYKDALLGGVGSLHDIEAVRDWVMKDAMDRALFPKVTDTSNFVIATSSGLIRYTTKPFAIVHGFDKCAFGSGRDFAYGALYAGADSITAVEAAIKYCASCSGEAYGATIGE